MGAFLMAADRRVLRMKPVRRPFFRVDLIFVIIAIFGGVIILLPFAWMVATSLLPANVAYAYPPRFFPNQFRYQNYVEVLKSSVPFAMLFMNSLKISVIITVAQLLTCSLAAYGFARLTFPGRDIIFRVLLATLMVPVQVTIIPIFLGMSKVGMVDTHYSLILPALTSVFGIFMLRQFFLTLPREFEDSGRMDGATYLRIFIRIILPQTGPTIAAFAILTFNNTWNNYFVPLVFLNSWAKMTLPLGIAALKGYMGSGNQSAVMAGVTMAALPVVLVFIFAQRYFIEGVALSGLKG